MEDAEARKVADVVAISALKYGDLSIRHPRIMFLISTVSPPSRRYRPLHPVYHCANQVYFE